jgi:hypothetical protein
MNTNELIALDVNKYVEKKNGLSYLSWSHAWEQALRIDPHAQFHVESWTDQHGNVKCWMDVNGTALVWVRVTLQGTTRACMLPVMNSRNEPISVEGKAFKDKFGKERIEKLDAFNVNTAIMRCMTKCLSLFGLGLYIYKGEDLPPTFDDEEPETKPEVKKEPEIKKEPEVKNEEEGFAAEDFAELMVNNVIIVKTLDGLRSYWKKNIESLKKLETVRPDLFQHVKAVMADKKAELENANA